MFICENLCHPCYPCSTVNGRSPIPALIEQHRSAVLPALSMINVRELIRLGPPFLQLSPKQATRVVVVKLSNKCLQYLTVWNYQADIPERIAPIRSPISFPRAKLNNSPSLNVMTISYPKSLFQKPLVWVKKILGLLPKSEAVSPPQQWQPEYSPNHLTHVTKVFEDGTVNLAIVVYFPKSYSPAAEELERPQPEEEWIVQVKVGDGEWQPLNRPESGQSYWTLELEKVPEGSEIIFRFKDSSGNWGSIVPPGDIERMYSIGYVPTLFHDWQNEPPKFKHAKVLMETTLEGMLAGYKNGIFAPRSEEELLQGSIAQRILKTEIPERLADLAVDQIMAPVSSSVAARCYLNPKFNYLTYNIADVDWQIGRACDFKQLVDRFYGNGIQIVPDLIFAHQVKCPFEGSGDQIVRSWDGKPLLVDVDAYLFRDYGTWMFDLANPDIRRILIEKIVSFARKYNLKLLRIDYMDGLILQYSRRDENFGEQFVRELKAELRRVEPELLILGEAFETAGNPVVKDSMDIFYAPVGFSLVEELYMPPSKMKRFLYPDLTPLIEQINKAANPTRKEAAYNQLHDETWYCEHITRGRPHVPWAYGANPAQLAKNKGEELVLMNLLSKENLLDFCRRTVRNAEALTMFSVNFQYLFVPAVDSLSLGSLDQPDRWKLVWEGITPEDLAEWKKTGLSERKIFQLHDQHRADMIKLREIFRTFTKINEDNYQPFVQPEIYYSDPEASILGLFRRNWQQPEESLVVIFNFSNRAFKDYLNYEIPVPEGFEGKWEVLFDGDWIDPVRRLSDEDTKGYPPGCVLETTRGSFSNREGILKLEIGGVSLVVLKYLPRSMTPPY
ncbi:MAG: hypothetical protein AB4426_28935 [Xenococcaceae cyanobacterium]